MEELKESINDIVLSGASDKQILDALLLLEWELSTELEIPSNKVSKEVYKAMKRVNKKLTESILRNT